MARFQIEKGERFSLNKSEGLEKVQIDLNWKSGADLDFQVRSNLAGSFACVLRSVLRSDPDICILYVNDDIRESGHRRWRVLTKIF